MSFLISMATPPPLVSLFLFIQVYPSRYGVCLLSFVSDSVIICALVWDAKVVRLGIFPRIPFGLEYTIDMVFVFFFLLWFFVRHFLLMFLKRTLLVVCLCSVVFLRMGFILGFSWSSSGSRGLYGLFWLMLFSWLFFLVLFFVMGVFFLVLGLLVISYR